MDVFLRGIAFVGQLTCDGFAREGNHFGAQALAAGKHKHQARKQQNCHDGRRNGNCQHAALHGALLFGFQLYDARGVARVARVACGAVDVRRVRLALGGNGRAANNARFGCLLLAGCGRIKFGCSCSLRGHERGFGRSECLRFRAGIRCRGHAAKHDGRSRGVRGSLRLRARFGAGLVLLVTV